MYLDLRTPTFSRFNDMFWFNEPQGRWASHETYKDGVLTITVDVPGFKEDNVEILAEGYEITIKGHSDRGKLFKSYRLSRDLDLDRIEATLDAGVLTLRIPQAESAKPKRIAVKTAGRLPPPEGEN